MDWKLELVAIPVGVTDAVPGTVRGVQLVVADVEAARAHLVDRGIEGNTWAVQQIPARG
jgi:hypothetical protein